MSVAYSDVVDVCKAAFYLLRQDGDVLTESNWNSGTPIEVAKCKAFVETVINEVVDDYRWSENPSKTNVSGWSSALRNALTYCLARELSIPIAGRTEDMKTYDAMYRDKVLQAKITDFNNGKAAITDADIKSVFALITVVCVHGDNKIPLSILDVIDRINVIKESARKEVINTHDWNFAKIVEPCGIDTCEGCCDGNYRYVLPYPGRALRVITVGRHGGRSNEWKVEGGYVKCKYVPTTITYIRDVADTSRWNTSARNAYVHRLAADVARTVMGNAQDAAMQEQVYRAALEDAKLRDTRESYTPTDAWGPNYYVEEMQKNRGCEFNRDWGF